VSIFSCAGGVVLGVVADECSVPRPRELVTEFERAFAEPESDL